MSVLYDFSGKVALITGSSSGIGANTALLFAKSGAQVVVNGVDEEDVHSVAKQCTDVSPKSLIALAVVADITDEEAVKRLVQSTIDTFGKLDILVNNAAIYVPSVMTDSDYIENYHKVLNTNLNSVVYLTQKCVQYLEKTNGNIINISSYKSVRAGNIDSAYCMAKSALDMFTLCMAAELAPKRIRVNSIVPGIIQTNFGSKYVDRTEFYKRNGSLLPVGRVGNGDDVANAILFVASEQGSFIDGIQLFVDGGQIAANITFR